MKQASKHTYISSKAKNISQPRPQVFEMEEHDADLNVVILAFDSMKNAESNIAGGDPYTCKKCGAILNKFSVIKTEVDPKGPKVQLKPNQSIWECEFCNYANVIMIEKEEIPTKDDVVYMLESALEQGQTDDDTTMIFCIDISGSMNTTSEIAGKTDLKFGMTQEEIDMLKQFMEPGDQAQFNFLPGAHNKNKTFISRKQCVLSAIESQIQEIKKKDPHKKVGFILFNNEVTIVGDGKSQSVHIVGDKLSKVPNIIEALSTFKLTTPLGQNYDVLLNKLSKTQAKGQTALGPALLSSIEVASKGSKGSIVVLCTDGLANVGVGSLQKADENSNQFYDEVAIRAKEKNVSVNIVTIKGESSKLQVLSRVVEATNGNVKVVNPEKLSEDFANILKDEVVGLNVEARIMLHKALEFRNEDPSFLKDNKTMLVKNFANATTKTKISFEYEVRGEKDLKHLEIDIEKLKKVPLQSQIIYQSPKGGKFLRVISSESETTTQKKELIKSANIGVVHQRVASNTAAMLSRGDIDGSAGYNDMWSSYMNKEFQAPQHLQKQEVFNEKNTKLRGTISTRAEKLSYKPKMPASVPQEKIVEVDESALEKEEKVESSSGIKGFFANLLSKKKPEPAVEKKPMKMSLEKMEVKKEVQHDSDEEEMEIKNYMMGKNEDFES